VFVLHVWRSEEVDADEVRLGLRPFKLVLFLEHDGFVVWVKNPVVGAKIEDVAMGNHLLVSHLDFSLLCPLRH
jgi:hypothetical protein